MSSIKIIQKHISISENSDHGFINNIVENKSICETTNNISVDFENNPISVTPIIFNQIIKPSGGDLIWLVTNSNTITINDTGYISTNSFSRINYTYGDIPINGTKLAFFNMGQGGFRILIDVIFGDKVTSLNGYLESLSYGDYVYMIYLNSKWVVQQSIGNINIL